ncbi:MAG: HD-like signal output (HDOD) protein [Rhodothermales bacterium]|jgi:HD-like signal output (HDOD) protein
MRLVDSPSLAAQTRVAEMAKKDPLVAVRLLKLVNSAYYGFASEVRDIDRAVRLLGPPSSVAGIVLGMSMVQMQATMEGPAGPLYTRLIRHSLATAYLAQWLETELEVEGGKRGAFSIGLLHDFGKIAFVFSYPEDAKKLYDSPEPRSDEQWSAAERELFGCSHQAAGHRLAEGLDLPPEVVGHLSGQTASSVSDIVIASEAAARAFGFSFNEPIDWESARSLEVWDRLVAAFPHRAGERDELLGNVLNRRSVVERNVFQLLRRKTDRLPVPIERNPAPRSGSRPAA